MAEVKKLQTSTSVQILPKLNEGTTAIGSATQPVYVTTAGGLAAISYTIKTNVPSNAVFTDTGFNTTATTGSGNAVTGISASGRTLTVTKGNVGTVTSIATGTGLKGGTISESGTIYLATAATGTIGGVKAYNVSTASVTATTGQSNKFGLEVDKNGKAYIGIPAYSNNAGTVTSIVVGTGLVPTNTTITSTGTIELASHSYTYLKGGGTTTGKALITKSDGTFQLSTALESGAYTSAYVLPSATKNALGGVKVYNVSTASVSPTTGQSNKFGLEVDKDGKAYIGISTYLTPVTAINVSVSGSQTPSFNSTFEIISSVSQNTSGQVSASTSTVTLPSPGNGGLTLKAGTDTIGSDFSADIATNKTYTIPVMTSTKYGVARLCTDTTQTVTSNAVSATSNRTYAIQKNGSNQLVVNVPWKDYDDAIATINTNISSALRYKGTIAGASSVSNTNVPVSADVGDTYKITSSTYFGDQKVESGDMVICYASYTTKPAAANVTNNWNIIQNNIDAATTDTKGYVKLATGDLSGKTYTAGEAAASAHTHGQYLTAETYTGTVTKIAVGTGLVPTNTTITSTGTIELATASTSKIGGIKVYNVNNNSGIIPTPTTGKSVRFGLELSSDGKAYIGIPSYVSTVQLGSNCTLPGTTASLLTLSATTGSLGNVNGTTVTVDLNADALETYIKSVIDSYLGSAAGFANVTYC